MKIKNKISTSQIFLIILLLLNGVYSLLIPHLTCRRSGADSIWAVLAGTLAGVVIMVVIHRIAMRYPEETVIEYLPKMVGKWMGKLIGLTICLFNFLVTLFYLNCFVEMLVAELLPNTPRFVLMGMTLLLIWWIVNNGLEDIARFSTLLAPLIILMSVLVILGNVQDMKLVNFLPFAQISQAGGMGFAVITAVSLFLTLINLLMVYPHITQPAKMRRMGIWAVLIAGGYICLMIFTTLSIFGALEGGRVVWPYIELARMIRVGPFLERVEAIFISVWLTIAFINGSFHTYCTAISWGQLLGSQRKKMIIFLVVVGVFLVSLMIAGMEGVMILQYGYSTIITWVILAVLFILLVASFRSDQKGAPHEE